MEDSAKLDKILKILLMSTVPGEVFGARDALIRVAGIGPHELAQILLDRAKRLEAPERVAVKDPFDNIPDVGRAPVRAPPPPAPPGTPAWARHMNTQRQAREAKQAAEREQAVRDAQAADALRRDAARQTVHDLKDQIRAAQQNCPPLTMPDSKMAAQEILDAFNDWLRLTPTEHGFVNDMLLWDNPTPKQLAWLEKLWRRAQIGRRN